jgi:alkylated DNA repair dioxygenase AlkB
MTLPQLPKDGCIQYIPAALDPAEATLLFDHLFETLPWQPDELIMFGQKIYTQRRVVWVGDPACCYTYSGIKRPPQPWTPALLSIKHKIESLAGCQFNACLINLYHNGAEGMGWHSDDEIELDPSAPIASLSLGGRRKFAFRHKQDKTRLAMFLEHASLLVMSPPVQTFWSHSLLKTKRPVAPRINLTFRRLRNTPI